MHKLLYYYGIYCFCVALHDGLNDALDEISEKINSKKKQAEEPNTTEEERRIKPKKHYNAKGEPMAKIGF